MKSRLSQYEHWLVEVNVCDALIERVDCKLDVSSGMIQCTESHDDFLFYCHRDDLWMLALQLGSAFPAAVWSQIGIRLCPCEDESTTPEGSLYSLADFHHHFAANWLVEPIANETLICERQRIASSQDINSTIGYDYFACCQAQDRFVNSRVLDECANHWNLQGHLQKVVAKGCIESICSSENPALGFVKIHLDLEEQGWGRQLDRLSLKNQNAINIAVEICPSDYSDPRQAKSLANEIRNRGMKLAVGERSGQGTSLQELQLLRPDYLKVSGELIRGVCMDSKREQLLSALLTISNDWGIQTIAEGIDQQTDCQWATDFGFHGLQGLFVGAPTPANFNVAPSAGVFATDEPFSTSNHSFGECQ